MPQNFTLTKLTPDCGALVEGLDLRQPLDETTAEALNQALAENCVLFFRDQDITPDQHKDLGRWFGQLYIHPVYPHTVEGHPEIIVLKADENSKKVAGEKWHSDASCDPEPVLGSILHLKVVPPVGGDTLFASMYAAYEALSEPMKAFLEDKTAIHDGAQPFRGAVYEGANPNATYPKAEHPIVSTHPVSGRKLLFVNRTFTTRIPQLSELESDAVLSMLYDHLENPKFQCRFQWQENSIAFWDNRCAQHRALFDYYPHRRLGQRVTIQGQRPV